MLMYITFVLSPDPLEPVIGDIENAETDGISLIVLLINSFLGMAVLWAAYRAFFGNAKDGVFVFIVVLLIAGVIFGIANFI